ncbi:copper resistance protein CopC [Actinoplanes sp. NPDC051859]|uniref:copper resistance protein CopC n=1 Tax=Actinoplanes sp. NPDC051859 TaxID=3363909 RepID=UPI0037A7009A
MRNSTTRRSLVAIPARLPPLAGRILVSVLAAGTVLVPGSPAWAHAQLVGADPAQQSTLAEAPAAVTLTFNERLNADFTTIVLSDAAKRAVPTSAAVVDGAKGTVTLTGAPANGAYTVAYRIVSVDGHAVQGSYSFTVADPALPAAAPSAVAGPVDQPADSGGLPTGVLIGLGAVGVLLAGLAAVFYRPARRRSKVR